MAQAERGRLDPLPGSAGEQGKRLTRRGGMLPGPYSLRGRHRSTQAAEGPAVPCGQVTSSKMPSGNGFLRLSTSSEEIANLPRVVMARTSSKLALDCGAVWSYRPEQSKPIGLCNDDRLHR